jgi:hypothetical protein
VLAAVACGGTPAPKKPDPPPAAPLPPCAPTGVVLPAGGKLACRELPLSVTFPAGLKITRQNDRALALYSAELDRGVMALLVEPRLDVPDASRISELLIALIKGIRSDADTLTIAAPQLAGATVSVGLSFKTPDGGDGVAHGYYANDFVFAAIVGGTRPESKPDTPAARAFLGSLELRPPVTAGTKRVALHGGAHLDLPANAWSTGAQPKQDGVHSEEIVILPDRKLWVGIRELEQRDRCDYLKGSVAGSPQDLGERLKVVFSNAQNPLTNIEPGKHGDFSVFAHADAGPMHVVMYVICAGKTALQLTVAGKQPNAELRPHLDEVARTLVGAK